MPGARDGGGPAPAGPLGDARLSRRSLLGLAGVGAVGLAGGVALGRGPGPLGAGTTSATGATGTAGAAARSGVVPFHGRHQAGILTPVQDHLHFAAWDLTTTSREDLIGLLRAWTAAAARMTAGLPAGRLGPSGGPYDAPPDDTGEAADLPAARLTLTFGFGPSLFVAADGTDRFGLGARRPAPLADLPHFPGDALEPERSGGDLCVQACADDPQVAVHAVRNLARLAFGVAAVRWSQLGYGRTSSTSTSQTTARNLFGFKDGTANLKAEEDAAVAEHLWARRDDSAHEPGDGSWMADGTYLVSRRIRMTVETWDRSSLREQEAVVGRTKATGAPLSGGGELTEPDLAATGRDGAPLIPADAHVRLAHPSANGGVRMLRRGYNYTDGSDGLGRLDAGLFFLAYVRDPRSQYVPVQMRLARDDAMSEYLRHTGSGLWAVPAGVPEDARLGPDGEFVGSALFA